MSGIKFTGVQLNKYVELTKEINQLSEEEAELFIMDTYNTTLDNDIKVICRAWWRTRQAVEEINENAKQVMERRNENLHDW